MVTLAERLRAAMTEARKLRDPARTLLLSTIVSDLKNREFELRHDASDEEAADVLRRGVKKRREAAALYQQAGRTELADRELTEVAILETFLPVAAGEDEVRGAVRAAIADGAQDLGSVMGRVMPGLKGRADGKLVNRVAREELAASP